LGYAHVTARAVGRDDFENGFGEIRNGVWHDP
jgi:hypothetical protein